MYFVFLFFLLFTYKYSANLLLMVDIVASDIFYRDAQISTCSSFTLVMGQGICSISVTLLVANSNSRANSGYGVYVCMYKYVYMYASL